MRFWQIKFPELFTFLAHQTTYPRHVYALPSRTPGWHLGPPPPPPGPGPWPQPAGSCRCRRTAPPPSLPRGGPGPRHRSGATLAGREGVRWGGGRSCAGSPRGSPNSSAALTPIANTNNGNKDNHHADGADNTDAQAPPGQICHRCVVRAQLCGCVGQRGWFRFTSPAWPL